MVSDPKARWTDNSIINRAIREQIRIMYERRFGRRFKESCLEELSRTEQDWIITEAGKEVNRLRGLGVRK